MEEDREGVARGREGKKISTKQYIADLVCFEQIVVEIKALDRLSGTEQAQVPNYLKGTGFPVGILINFGSHGRLQWNRLVK